ncbi:PAS domain S-box protein [Roseicella frigidaeris]|uniref:histidine kinase n=1 Tax=Roseicella frigidaeris TaxID=2230885 RepID=A0A327MCM6_9PROT|nr:PAS domain S-box protein [Roseicella frigidaeris]RAI59914.1 hypothetical protein DOO78_06625 [Roseicella frigidaeris]
MPDSLLDHHDLHPGPGGGAAAWSPAGQLPRPGLRRRLLHLLLPPGLAAALAITVAAWTAAEAGLRAFEAELQQGAHDLALALGAEIDARIAALDAFAAAFGEGLDQAEPAAARAVRTSRASGMRLMVGGAARRPAPPEAGPGSAAAAILRAAVAENRPVLSNLIPALSAARPGLLLAVPVPRADGTPPGLAIGGVLELERFEALLRAAPLGPGLAAGLADAAGTLLLRTDSGLRGPVPTQSEASWRRGVAGRLVLRRGADGRERIAALAEVPAAPGWTAVVEAPAAAHRAAGWRPAGGLAAGLGLALLAAGLASWALARGLLLPMRRLSAMADDLLSMARLGGMAEARSAPRAALPPVAELAALQRGLAAAGAAFDRQAEAERRGFARQAEAAAMLAAAERLTGAGGWTLELAGTDDLDAARLRWTEQTQRVLGLAPVHASVPVALFLAAVPSAERPRLRAALHQALRDGAPCRLEHRIRRPDGSLRLIEQCGVPERDAAGRVWRIVGSCLDVTERRMHEAVRAENAARLQDLLSTLDLAAFMAREVEGAIRFWSKECERLYGWTAAEALGQPAHALLGTEFPVPQAEIAAALEDKGSWQGELRQRRRDGRAVVVFVHKALRRDAAGRPLAVVESLADVTALQAARQALAESEVRLRLALEGVGLGLWEEELGQNRLRLDPQAAAVAGGMLPARVWLAYDGPEFAAWDRAVHPEDQARRDAWRSAIAGGGAGLLAADIRIRAGEAWRWVSFRSTVVERGADGRALRVLTLARDVTEPMEAAEAQRESEARLRSVVESALDAIVVASIEGDIVSVNRAAVRMFGHSGAEAMVGRDLGMLMPEAEARQHGARLARRAAAPTMRPMTPGRTLMARRADGSEFPIEASVCSFEVGGRRFVTGILRDVTDRVASERALAASEARLRTIVETVPVGLVMTELPSGRIIGGNRYAGQLLRLPELRDAADWVAFHADGSPLQEHEYPLARLLHAGEENPSIEAQCQRGDGSRAWMRIMARPVRNEAGELVGGVTAFVDVDSERQTREALAASEARYRTLFARMEEGFALWEAVRDATGAITDFRLLERNEAVQRVTGRMPPGSVGRGMRALFPEMTAQWFDVHVRTAETGEPAAVEGRVSLGRRWLSTRLYRPEPDRLAMLVRDVTERVAAEAAVRGSEAMLRHVLDNLFAYVAVLAPDGTVLDTNRAPLEAAGLAREAVLGQPFWDTPWWAFDPAVAARMREACAGALSGAATRFDTEARMAGEGRVVLDVQIAPLRDAEGRVTHLIASAVDITERKRSEEAKLLLAREVDHRAKNALAVVQSVLTLTRTEEPAAFKAAVKGRIAAMALAHTLLARERWNGADLRELLAEELAAYRGAGSEAAVLLDGPLVGLAPDAAQPVAMAIHELATNAAKYGALSTPEGRVCIHWQREPIAGGLTLVWQESGGPPVTAPPARRGFGSSLIQGTVVRQLQGSLEMHWEAPGLRCVLSLPARQVLWRTAAARPGEPDSNGR